MEEYVEVKATVRIPNDKIRNLIICAIDVVSSYWAKFVFPDGWEEKYKSYSRIPFEGGEIEVYDNETGELLGVLNRATIQTGLQLMADRKDMTGREVPARHFKAFATDNEDAETADVFVQLCVLGEIIYR
jgi:hypothetical protein